MAKEASNFKLIANNKKARHDYFLEETFEAGVELHGTEVKSLRQGNCSIKEAFVHIENGEVIIYGMHINPDFVCQLAYGRKRLSLMKMGSSYP